jgi:hypothetical protein
VGLYTTSAVNLDNRKKKRLSQIPAEKTYQSTRKKKKHAQRIPEKLIGQNLEIMRIKIRRMKLKNKLR